MSEVSIGTRAEEDIEAESVYDDPIVLASAWRFLKPHSDSKTSAAVESILASGAAAKTAPKPSRVTIPEWVLKRHSLIFGKSGYGKSSLALRLIAEQLERGCSLVAIDRDTSTLRKLRAVACAAGISANRTFTIDATEPEFTPGFNPFRMARAPGEIAALMEEFLDDGSGVRITQFLHNVLILVAYHRMEFRDIPRLLNDTAFRNAMLDAGPCCPKDSRYIETERFFRTRYLDIKESERTSSILSLEIRLEKVLGYPVFQQMFNAPKNSFDFKDFFEDRHALFVSVGRTGGMGDASRRVLAELTMYLLEQSGYEKAPVPVILSIDEIGSNKGSVSEALSRIASSSRKQNIRLLLSTQYPHQFDEDLRRDVMGNSSFKAYFQMDHDALYSTASLLAAGEEEEDRPEYRVIAGQETLIYEGPVLSERIGDTALYQLETWADPPSVPLVVDTQNLRGDLERFAEFGFLIPDGAPLLLGESGEFVASEVIQDLPPGSVKLRWVGDFPPKYAEAKISVPAVAVVANKKGRRLVDRWLKTLKSAPVGTAVVVIGTEQPQPVIVDWAETPEDAPPRFLREMAEATAAPPYVPLPIEIPPPIKTPPPTAAKPSKVAEPPTPKPEPRNANVPPTEDIRGTFEE